MPNKTKILLASWILSFIPLLFPFPVLAVMQSLNGQTGQSQTFQNDSNISINSLNNIHSLIWNGVLPVSRGGTGASAFTNGSIPFISGGVFSEDNSGVYWNNTLKRLGVGTNTPAVELHVAGSILSAPPGGGANDGIRMDTNGDIDLNSINFLRPRGVSQLYETSSGTIGITPSLTIEHWQANNTGITLNISQVTDSIKVINFQNLSGTLPLLEAPQVFTGLNKFESSTNSTIYVGSSVKSGCIALGDSDGNGFTYITANDGVLTASATKPSICQ